MRLERLAMLRDNNERISEAIFDYITSSAATAAQGREIMKQMRFMPRDDPRKQEALKVVVHLLEQIEKHYEDSFGLKPSWEALRK